MGIQISMVIIFAIFKVPTIKMYTEPDTEFEYLMQKTYIWFLLAIFTAGIVGYQKGI